MNKAEHKDRDGDCSDLFLVSSSVFFSCLLQVKRSFGLCSLQLTYFDEENEEVRDLFFKHRLFHVELTVIRYRG